MSYILYINEFQIDLLEGTPIAQTLQVNDIARLDNRQSNFTNKFIAPPTANNKRAMDLLYLVGNNSNIPYQKNEATLFDAESGACLVYKGWATITQTTDKGYEIHVYDGIVDFYRSIENKTLTEIGVPDLNHVKNVANVVNSWTDDLPYKYLVADYNGKNSYVSNVGTVNINIDFQIPSAKCSYIWDRIFQYSGFNYLGNVFESEDFVNFYMTFPKPVPTIVPVLEHINTQNSIFRLATVDGNTFTNIYPFSDPVNSPYVTSAGDGVFEVIQSGTFYISGTTTMNINGALSGKIYNGIAQTGPSINLVNEETMLVQLNAGDTFILSGDTFYDIPTVQGNMTSSISLLLGYDANFEEVLADFKATEFVNEIMQRFALTMFKDKYSNTLEFLTLDEILQNGEVIDWSSKFSSKGPEKYIVGNYAQINNFKYRYNEENDKHNDGFIRVNNVNLKDETTIIASKIYSPELGVGFIGPEKNVYRFWNKEIQENGDIKYKDLSGRYYFVRSQNVLTGALVIGSEVLNTQEQVSELPIASYSRLKFQEIINIYYASIQNILYKAKINQINIYLKPGDIETFSFKKLIHIEQLGKTYLVNKIPNFIKGKLTNCELIEVKKSNSSVIIEPTFIVLNTITVDGCNFIIEFSIDIQFPSFIRVVGSRNNFGIPNPETDIVDTIIEVNSTTVVVTVPMGGLWFFRFIYQNIESNSISATNSDVCNYTPPEQSLTSLVITSVQTLSIVGNDRLIRVNYTSDLSTGSMTLNCSAFYIGSQFNYPFYLQPQNGFVEITVAQNGIGEGEVAIWEIQLSALGIYSNTVTS